jgi:hypothetical protein
MPIYFYLCCGLNPSVSDLPQLTNRLQQIIMGTGVIISLILWSKIQYFKFQIAVAPLENIIKPSRGNLWPENHQLKDMPRIFSTLLMLILTIIFQYLVNNINLNLYPNHLVEHFFRYYWTNVIASFLVFIHFKKPSRILSFWRKTLFNK